jgi:hypothetical protein
MASTHIMRMPPSRRLAAAVSGPSASSLEAALLLRGYTRRTTASEPRLSEIVAEYRRIGFEVEVIEHRVEPGQCGVCFGLEAGAAGTFHDVFVHHAAPATKD